MRKKVAILGILCFASGVFAEDIDKQIDKIRKSSYEEGYKVGYTEGYSKGLEEGKKEGMKEVFNRLDLYSDLLEGIFNYKKLLKDGYILPPQVALICNPDNFNEGEYRLGNCYYKIVSNAKIVNPKEFNYQTLIKEGKIYEVVDKSKEKKEDITIMDRVLYVGNYPYDVGLTIIKKLNSFGVKTIQKNTQGKLYIAVYMPNDKNIYEAMQKEFTLKEMDIRDFMNLKE